jgi:hypothetical protein
VDLSEAFTLNSPEIYFGFDDKHPVSIHVKDSLAYILQIQSDTCLIVLDLNKKEIIRSVGNVGYGPNDIIRPDFVASINNPDVLLEDGSVKKFLKIDADKYKKTFSLEKYIEYPKPIFPSGETNFSKNFIAGRKVGKGKMFYIYDRNTASMTEIEYYPAIKDLKHDPNYIYAPTIALNENRNRIVAGMYLFDMFHLYDLTGKRIETFCFSENCIPDLSSKDLMRDLQNCRAGIIRTFPTSDYCYLLRITGNRLADRTENMLLKINWDGQLIRAYKIQDHIEGGFFVNEDERKMYAIRHIVNSDPSEIYEIVSYPIN